jgi:hypothetical protein
MLLETQMWRPGKRLILRLISISTSTLPLTYNAFLGRILAAKGMESSLECSGIKKHRANTVYIVT